MTNTRDVFAGIYSIPTVRTYVVANDIASSAGNSTASVAITGLSFAYVSNAKYMLDGCFLVKTSVAACGIKLKLDSSGTVTKIALDYDHQLANTGTRTGGQCIADNTFAGYSSGLPALNTVIPCTVRGLLVTGTGQAGTVTVRMAPEIAGKVTMMANSMLVVTRVK